MYNISVEVGLLQGTGYVKLYFYFLSYQINVVTTINLIKAN
jgi:hypothetical protein